MASLIALRRAGRLLAAFALAAVSNAHADIVIGQVAPFSGTQAVTGKAINAGVRLYFDAVNAAGGVKGQRIRLVTRDDGQKVEETVRLAKELIERESPVALIGTVGTSNLEALSKDGVLAAKRVSMVGAISGAASVASARGLYPVKAGYREEVRRLFEQLTHAGRKRVGIVYQDDGLGRDALAGAEAAAQAFGITLVGKAGYPRNTVQVDEAVQAMRKLKPDVVFLGATTAAAIEFVRRYRLQGGHASLYGMSIIDTQAVLRELGPHGARGYAFSLVLPATDRSDRELLREYSRLSEASRDPDLSSRSIEGFVAAKALVKALERAPRFTAQALSETLEKGLDVDVGDYRLSFGRPGQAPSRFVDFAMLGERGRLVR